MGESFQGDLVFCAVFFSLPLQVYNPSRQKVIFSVHFCRSREAPSAEHPHQRRSAQQRTAHATFLSWPQLTCQCPVLEHLFYMFNKIVQMFWSARRVFIRIYQSVWLSDADSSMEKYDSATLLPKNTSCNWRPPASRWGKPVLELEMHDTIYKLQPKVHCCTLGCPSKTCYF